MLPYLNWAIWALVIPLSVAERPPVKWEDLMIATSRFPRFFGEVTTINRTGEPKVNGAAQTDGTLTPVTCVKDHTTYVKCDEGDWIVVKELRPIVREIQYHSPPYMNDLRFTIEKIDWSKGEDGTIFRTFFLSQSNLDGMITIDNTFVKVHKDERTNGDYVRHASTEYMLYTGEFDHGSQEPSCTHFQARDTAEYAALEQPFWDALYPAKEYKLVYTVQDGGLYLTWRLTFNLKDKVGDDFVVWVDARNCTQIVAAAPAEMGLYVRTREDWYDRHAKLFKDRGITIGS